MKRKELILDRYQPVQQAGSGGFGTVVKAWDTRIQRWVAIKTIQLSEVDAARAASTTSEDLYAFTPPWESYPQDPAFLDAVDARHAGTNGVYEDPSADDGQQPVSLSLLTGHPVRELANIPGLDEARTAAMLQDSNIVQVYDFEVRGSVAYLIMEYVDGISLSKLLRDFDDKLTLNQIAAVFSGVSHALTVAHANSVLHLDIKPDNVLIDVKGRVKVTDFGLATLADAQGMGFAGGGTIGYMPPEQIGQEPLDERCDEWALASVTYEMLNGENPFRVRQLAKATEAIEEAELVLPSLCWNDLDAQADDTLFMALDPCKDERYESVEDFAEEFLPLLGDPKSGRHELAQLVNFQDLEDEEEEEAEHPIVSRESMRDRALRGANTIRGFGAPRPRKILSRVVGCAGSTLVAFFALANMQILVGSDGLLPYGSLFTPAVFTDQPIFWALVLAVAIVGAMSSSWGALCSFQLLGASFVANGQPVAGLLFMLGTALWWYFVGKQKSSMANVAFAPPLAGMLGLSQVTPFAAGLCLSPLRAAVSTAYALLVAAMLAACTGGSLFLWHPLSVEFGNASIAFANIFGRAPFWCMAAGWLVSSLVVSMMCRGRRGVLPVMGSVLASCVMLTALVVAAWFNTGGTSAMPSLLNLALTVLPILMLFIVVLAADAPVIDERDYDFDCEYE